MLMLMSSASGTVKEGAVDLAYRGVMPRGLGRALSGLMDTSAFTNPDEEVDIEDEASLREGGILRAEAARRDALRRRCWAPYKVTALLLLGIRCI